MHRLYLRPENVQKQSEDVAFEEAEFGFEAEAAEAGDETESEDESELEGIFRARTADDCQALCSETKCIAFLSQLKALAMINVSACKVCGSKEIEIHEDFTGSALYFKWVRHNIKFHLLSSQEHLATWMLYHCMDRIINVSTVFSSSGILWL